LTTSDEYFKEYVSLGGQKNRQEYDKNIVIFFEETHDIFIDGNPIKHKTRGKAGNAVMKKAHISEQEYNLMFESVDNITSYT
tara:strand:- start:216 stop:461 length:246 start_codon:yes stop_codon:yes gene_type:complete